MNLARPRHLSPHRDTPKSPLERLCRLAGRTTFITPDTGGRSADALTPQDLAHALGCVRDPLAQAMAMAVSSQWLGNWTYVRSLAHPLLMDRLESLRMTSTPPTPVQRHRARMVLCDVYVDVVLHRRPRYNRLARALRMRNKDCRTMYRHAAALLEEAAHTGAREACERLFAGD